MRHIKRHILVPAILLAYLGVMACLGLDGLRSGQTFPAQYAATVVITLAVIVALYFFLRRRDRLRDERLRDTDNSNNNIKH